MFSFDGEDEELLCVSVAAFINAIPNHTVAGEGGAASLDGCHKYKLPRLLAMLGSADPSRMATQDAASFKGVQLLTQWLALPTTETMVHLMFSNARRAMPASLQHTASAPNLSAAPLAPTNLRSRWSVSGGTPRRPPTIVQSPTSSSAQATPRKRRMSEPTLPTLAFGTPSPSQLGSGEVLDDAAAKLASPRSSNRPIRSPGSKNEQAAAELVHSPLSYFGTQPDVSSRFVQVPSGDGGVQAFFEHAAGAAGVLGPAELLQLGVERLDLPRAVARLVAKRAQEHQRILDEEAVASANAGCDIAPGQDENARPQGACSSRASPTAACPTAAAPVDGDRTERPVSFAAYYAAYGRHRPEETDRIRLFRLVKRPGSPWVLPADLTELVWAVSETHVGLEFLRDSDEFLKSYVQTTSLRILWALAGAGTQRITLQSWRHSSLVEVLFQLDEEADINLARDYFSYNHFYVIWCIFWELDEDEYAWHRPLPLAHIMHTTRSRTTRARPTGVLCVHHAAAGMPSCKRPTCCAMARTASLHAPSTGSGTCATRRTRRVCNTPTSSSFCSPRRTSKRPRRSSTGSTSSTSTATATWMPTTCVTFTTSCRPASRPWTRRSSPLRRSSMSSWISSSRPCVGASASGSSSGAASGSIWSRR